jgi:hypothetical protein
MSAPLGYQTPGEPEVMTRGQARFTISFECAGRASIGNMQCPKCRGDGQPPAEGNRCSGENAGKHAHIASDGEQSKRQRYSGEDRAQCGQTSASVESRRQVR